MRTSKRRVQEVFIELIDTLVTDFDIIDYLDRLAASFVELLPVSACGILLADHHGMLNLVAASTEEARLVELAQLQNAEGPCLDAFRTGRPVQHAGLTGAQSRWPSFAAAAMEVGYAAVQAMPMRLRDTVIGAVNLFSTTTSPLDADAVALGQALADAAAIGILHQRALAREEALTGQLQTALNSRITIEQAKGYLARRLGTSVEDAFTILRQYTRSHNRRLTDTAAAVISGTLDLTFPRPKPPGTRP